MSQNTSSLTRRPWLRWTALGAVVLVPLAFAGLFIGAVSNIGKGVSEIPAAIVNNDTAVTEAGSKTPVLAGRELVTELTGAKSAGFNWTITNSADAKADLANGTVYAILTVPKNFSKSIVSLSGKSPQKANLQITTDDAHNYLTGSVAQVVGDSLSSAFGQAITKQYIAGIYSGIGSVGKSLSTAADGATKLGSGASSLASGLSTLSAGTKASATGASQLASGTSQYVGGVSSIASGLHSLVGTSKNPGVTQYTQGVSQISAGLTAAAKTLATTPNTDPAYAQALATIQQLAPGLAAASKGGPALTSGVKQLSSGAGELASQGSSLSSGTSSLASGISKLASGTSASASGAHSLADGVNKLAAGLTSGAAQVPSVSAAQAKATAAVASDPVGVTVDRKHEVSSPAQIIATLFVPLGLWIGSLAVFLVMRPMTRRALSSTAKDSRLVLSAVGRASIVTGAQAALLAVLLHVAVGVSWSLFPASLAFSVLMALAFTAFHYLLTIGLGRGGLVVSIFLLAVQITSTGGLYPIQLLAKPFQVASPFLPLTYGVQGMQAIIANSGVADAVGASLALVVFGVGSLLIALVAVRRVRRARALGLVPASV
ncbi:MAG: putative rane protein [Actinomycetota bacterium]|nr:YhgE/Pip protein [Glaciihabitans sp.]MDQ1543702.1 putative rane protein [Actinomycetota bacterium]MDQ1560805.1 putative rane protein [Actinomycetota bacterium]